MILIDISLNKSDTVKQLQPHRRDNAVKPKIGGKDHSEVLNSEMLRNSTRDLMQLKTDALQKSNCGTSTEGEKL